MTCDGPTQIATPSDKDLAALMTIEEILSAPPARINLQRAGLRAVEHVASRDQKRTELPRPQPVPGG